MVFSSTVFLFIFLPLVMISNMLLPKSCRNALLLFASLLFYAWGEPVYVLLMLVSILVNHTGALFINKTAVLERKRLLLALFIVFDLALLFVFKYANFITYNLSRSTFINIIPARIALPIGISFFTFQAMSYIIDVYRNTSKAERNISHTALYISFFPQLIAGPIIKHHDIAAQISKREVTVDKTYTGIIRFITGLSKKLLIANILGEAADIIFTLDPYMIGTHIAWTGAVFYTLQIYFDFSGYSDMAIGLGLIFGFEFKENFNHPFVSSSMNEFWKRWHISLTNWFREYLYFPLGGNRKGTFRTYLNLLIVFFCTGFWHGAEWTFIIWGMTHGFFMLLEKSRVIRISKDKYNITGNLYCLMIVTVTFTIFRAPDMVYALSFLRLMFSYAKDTAMISPVIFAPIRIFVLAAALLASFPVSGIFKRIIPERHFTRLRSASALVLFILCVLVLSGESYNPFIYFRF